MRYALLVILILVTILRYFLSKKKGRHPNALFVSLFVQQIPLGCVAYTLPFSLGVNNISGAFPTYFSIDVSIVLILMMLLLNVKQIKDHIKVKNSPIFMFGIVILFISILNPNNLGRTLALPIFFTFVQLYVFFTFLSRYVNSSILVDGIFDGLKITLSIQAFLVLLYPILGISSVLSLFRGDDIAYWASRREGYDSALGTFLHPGALALFATLAALFFLACILRKYRKKESLVYILLCFFIIAFTYSRTSYAVCLGALFCVYIIYSNIKKIRISTIIYFLFGIIAVYIILLNTSLYDMFFKSDSDSQLENRMIHYMLAFEMWENNKIIGLGINTHVSYMSTILNPTSLGNVHEFFTTNPVHNIHLIVLVETGIVGIIMWVYYLSTRILVGFKNSYNNNIDSVINLAFAGMLIAFVTYGMTGWAGFQREIYSLILFVGFFTSYNRKS